MLPLLVVEIISNDAFPLEFLFAHFTIANEASVFILSLQSLILDEGSLGSVLLLLFDDSLVLLRNLSLLQLVVFLGELSLRLVLMLGLH